MTMGDRIKAARLAAGMSQAAGTRTSEGRGRGHRRGVRCRMNSLMDAIVDALTEVLMQLLGLDTGKKGR